METVVVFDIESSKMPEWKIPSDSPEQPHIVQLAAALYNVQTKEIIQSMDVIVRPDGWEIEQVTIDIHGITQEHALEVGIPEEVALEMLICMAGDATRVCYNRTFDQRMIRIALKRYEYAEQAIDKWAEKDNFDCAMQMARKAIGGKQPKLVDAYQHLTGKTLENAHTALADMKACAEIYFIMKESE